MRRSLLVLPALFVAMTLVTACGSNTENGKGRTAARTADRTTSDAAPPSPAPSSDPASTLSPAPAGVDKLAQLRKLAPGKVQSLVFAPDAAATWDSSGNIDFWVYGRTNWLKRGSSTFPKRISGGKAFEVKGYALADTAVEPDKTRVVVYVVTGQFTTDGGSGVAVFGPGAKGWGALVESGDTLASTGKGASVATGAGLYQGVTIGTNEAHTLHIATCSDSVPRYKCDDHTVENSFWQWDSGKQTFPLVAR